MRIEKRYLRQFQSGRGFVLPFVVVLMVVMVLVGFGMLSLGYNAKVQSLRYSEDTYAISAAEAGIVHMVERMNDKLEEDEEWDNTTLFMLNMPYVKLPNSHAEYRVRIIGNPSMGFVITSTGRSGQAKRTFFAMTLLRGVFDYGILVKDKIKLYENCVVSAYNSETGQSGLGTIIATVDSKGGATVDLKEAYVHGDVLVGPGGDPDKMINNRGTITGKAGNISSMPEFPEVSVPDELEYNWWFKNKIKSGDGEETLPGTTFAISGNKNYSEIELSNNDVLEISGDTSIYVTGDVEIEDSAEIRIKDDGTSSLTLYVDGKFEIKDGAIINNLTKKPENFKLFGSSPKNQKIEIDTDRQGYNFYGVVYAPNAEVEVGLDGDIYGSFVCDKFELKSESSFYHDRSTTKNINDAGVYFGIGRWYEP